MSWILVGLSKPAIAMHPAETMVRAEYSEIVRFPEPTPAQATQAARIFQAHFDFDVFFARCARDIQNQLTPIEGDNIRTEFEKLFFLNFEKKTASLARHRILKPQYTIVLRSDSLQSVELRGTRPDLQKTTVKFLVGQKQGKWLVVDLEVDGALLSRQYQGSFNKIFRDKGASGIIENLRQKIQEEQQKSPQSPGQSAGSLR